MLLRATAAKKERRFAETRSDRLLTTAVVLLIRVIGSLATLVFWPMENAIRRAFPEKVESRSKAEAADRSESEFLANMSQKICTLMNGVLGMAELLARADLMPRQKIFTEVIVKLGNALLTIINDVLDSLLERCWLTDARPGSVLSRQSC